MEGRYLVARRIVADNGCPSINDLVTVGAGKFLRRSAIRCAARRATLPRSSSLIKKREAEAPRHHTAPMPFAQPAKAIGKSHPR
jgi:hypothetical protein